MINKVVSFYSVDLINLELILQTQKKVFDHFGITLEQLPCPEGIPHEHSEAMNGYLSNATNWDYVTIFDIDCVPTSKDTVNNAIDIVKDGNTIFGNAQACLNEIPYAAPNFFTISRQVWEKTLKIWDENKTLHRDIFRYQTYDRDGKEVICDVGEKFNIENRKAGSNIRLSYPTYNEQETLWSYTGGNGYPNFSWGRGTWFDSKTFHSVEIRYKHRQQLFFDVCNRIIHTM